MPFTQLLRNNPAVKPTMARKATKDALQCWWRRIAHSLPEEKMVTMLMLFLRESQNLAVKS